MDQESTTTEMTMTTTALAALVAQQRDALARLETEKAALQAKVETLQHHQQLQLGQTLDQVREQNRAIESALAAHAGVQDGLVESFLGKLDDLNPPLLCDDPKVLKAHIETLTDELLAQRRANDKLKIDLDIEASRVTILRADNQALKQATVNLQASAEMEEEFISNMLTKRIRDLQREKGELLMRVEAEEEMITNQLQKKLQQLQKDKIDMEMALEKEQEFMVNRLQKQLDELRGRLGNGLSISTSSTKKWSYAHSNSSSLSELTSPTIAPGVVEVLKAEVNATKFKLQETERAFDEWSNRTCLLYNNLRQLTALLIAGDDRSSKESAGDTDTLLKSDLPAVKDLSSAALEEQFPVSIQPLKFGPDTLPPGSSTSQNTGTAAGTAAPLATANASNPGTAGVLGGIPSSTSAPSLNGIAPIIYRMPSFTSSARSSISHRSPSASPVMGSMIDSQSHRIPRTLGRSNH